MVHAGHDRPLAVVVHGDEVVHPPPHCILTVKGEPSAGTRLNATRSMKRELASYRTVKVLMFEPLNALISMKVQPEVRMPHSSGNV